MWWRQGNRKTGDGERAEGRWRRREIKGGGREEVTDSLYMLDPEKTSVAWNTYIIYPRD